MRAMQSPTRLNKPELFKRFPYGFVRLLPKLMLRAANQAAADNGYQPNIAVVVRTRNDRPGLEKIIKHIKNEQQHYKGRIDLIVVDTESTDGTAEAAAKSGASLVKIKQANFNYPKGINLGLAAAKPDVEAAFVTVGHAEPALSNCLAAGARHFADQQVAGVYSDYLPDSNASFWERLTYFFNLGIVIRMRHGAHETSKTHGGIMQAVCCFVRISAWHKYPFDEAYGHGGEDVEWARQAFKNGHLLIYDPAVAVYHSHGLGLRNYLHQVRHWAYIYRHPGEFDTKKIHAHRPDLR